MNIQTLILELFSSAPIEYRQSRVYSKPFMRGLCLWNRDCDCGIDREVLGVQPTPTVTKARSSQELGTFGLGSVMIEGVLESRK